MKQTLEAVDGVESAMPDLNSGDVIINGDDLDREKLASAVRDAGYSVKE